MTHTSDKVSSYFFLNFQSTFSPRLNFIMTSSSIIVALCTGYIIHFLFVHIYLYYNSPVSLSVGVRKLRVAILARSSREMSLTVRIV